MLKTLQKIVLSSVLITITENCWAYSGEGVHTPTWLIIPFVALLLMIATGPILYEHFWHRNYVKISIALAIFVMGYYILVLDDFGGPIHALVEYVPFISFLLALYVASGGISIVVNKRATPMANVILLFIGAVIANLIGTTGASMLLIRPFIKMNKGRVHPYHIIFFIFIVSNVGGALTPIGDPPLFLGFLKGVPFFWTLTHNWLPCLFTVTCLLILFYLRDIKNNVDVKQDPNVNRSGSAIQFSGKKNFIWLLLIAGGIFLDPNVFSFIPSIDYHGTKISFVKEILWILITFLSHKGASKKAYELNSFNFEPIKEVAFLFIGIFGTMTPALALVSQMASESGPELITTDVLYFFTGILSGFLDNAPTYVNFLAAGMSTVSLDIGSASDVASFALNHGIKLEAISAAAVFFGAMTYIGNGPNFMVKSIAEHSGINMPSFFSYMIKFSLPYLLIILVLDWVIFYSGYVL